MTMSLKAEATQQLSWSFELPNKEKNLTNVKNIILIETSMFNQDKERGNT